MHVFKKVLVLCWKGCSVLYESKATSARLGWNGCQEKEGRKELPLQHLVPLANKHSSRTVRKERAPVAVLQETVSQIKKELYFAPA